MNQRLGHESRAAATSAAAAALVLLTLTGCAYASQDCSEGVCGLHLVGSGAHLTIDADRLPDSAVAGDVTVELVEISGGRAVFTINGERGTCAAGESLMVSGLQVAGMGIDEDEERMSMEVTA